MPDWIISDKVLSLKAILPAILAPPPPSKASIKLAVILSPWVASSSSKAL